MSTSDNDAVELSSTSANDIKELYPSERDNHCRLNLPSPILACQVTQRMNLMKFLEC